MKEKRYIYSSVNNSFYDSLNIDMRRIPKPFVYLSSDEYTKLRIVLGRDSDKIVISDENGKPKIVHRDYNLSLEELKLKKINDINTSFQTEYFNTKYCNFKNYKFDIKLFSLEVSYALNTNSEINILDTNTGSFIKLSYDEVKLLMKNYMEQLNSLVYKFENIKHNIESSNDRNVIECFEWSESTNE